MDCSIVADRAFGPSVAQCRRTFDFTFFFEETIFSLTPSVIFILLATFRLYVLLKRPSRVQRGYLYKLKLVSLSCYIKMTKADQSQVTSTLYASLQFCVLVEYCTIGQIKTRASIPSAALAFLASILLCLTSLLEHTKSLAPSFLLSIYLLVTVLLDTVRIRTLWQAGESITLCSTFVAGFATKLALLVAESWSKRNYLAIKDREVASEEIAGFVSKSLFLWLNPLLMKGFSHWLTPPDLSPIDIVLSSARIAKSFEGVAYTHYGKVPHFLELSNRNPPELCK